jgi:hypothetical protein
MSTDHEFHVQTTAEDQPEAARHQARCGLCGWEGPMRPSYDEATEDGRVHAAGTEPVAE